MYHQNPEGTEHTQEGAAGSAGGVRWMAQFKYYWQGPKIVWIDPGGNPILDYTGLESLQA